MKRERTEEEKKAGTLPLTPSLEGIPGNPRYAVNMLKLPTKDEGKRETIFYHIYRKTLVFDTMVNALDYVAKCMVERQDLEEPPFHAVYTMDGHRIGTNGIIDMRNKIPSKLPVMYGQGPVPPVAVEEAHVGDDVAVAERAVSYASQRVEAHAELTQLRAEEGQGVKDKEERIEELRQCLVDLELGGGGGGSVEFLLSQQQEGGSSQSKKRKHAP